MINSVEFMELVSKGYIPGECDKVTLEMLHRNLHCKYVSDDHTMSVSIEYTKYNDGNYFFGTDPITISSIAVALKMLKVLSTDCEMQLVVDKNQRILMVNDDSLEVRIPLLHTSQTPTYPKLNHNALTGVCSYRCPIDTDFIKYFKQLSRAVPKAKYVYFVGESLSMQMMISETEDYTLGVKLNLPDGMINGDVFEESKFSVKKLKHIFQNNEKCISGEMVVYSGLLIILRFYYEKYEVNYRLVAD